MIESPVSTGASPGDRARRELKPELPLESGRPRVQRLIDELMPVHLELEPPTNEAWTLAVDGAVGQPREFSLTELCDLGLQPREIDFHCVWGWSRTRTRWSGVAVEDLFELVEPTSDARYVMLRAQDSPYASCVPLADALAGFLAVELDGAPLTPLHGGPLRWVPPHYMYGYKGVKWLASITLQSEFTPGFWEEAVGDVRGYVPDGILAMFDDHAAQTATEDAS